MQHCAGFISAGSLYMFRGVKRPSSGVFKTSTAATGTCVIVAGKSSHLVIFLILCFRASQYKSNETPTWCNTVQVLFLQGHSALKLLIKLLVGCLLFFKGKLLKRKILWRLIIGNRYIDVSKKTVASFFGLGHLPSSALSLIRIRWTAVNTIMIHGAKEMAFVGEPRDSCCRVKKSDVNYRGADKSLARLGRKQT